MLTNRLDHPGILNNRSPCMSSPLVGIHLGILKKYSPWMSSVLARYCPGILNRIHPGCLACNYPHHLGIHLLNVPEMVRRSAWCPCCLLYYRKSNTWTCTLVKKRPAGCPYSVGYLAFISHPQLPAALTMAPCQSLNRLRPGRMS